MFNFEKLETWQKAIDFADPVYSLARNFPDEEKFGLTSQMRRAAVSVSSNIAEGSSRMSRADYARFLELASGSLFEVISQSVIGLRQRFPSRASYDQLYALQKNKAACLAASAVLL